MKAPCKDCTRRCAGCHGSCEDYTAWQEELRAKNTKIWQARKADYASRSYQMQSVARTKKTSHKQ